MDRRVLIETILTLVPVLHKKFSKDLGSCEITRQQMELLYFINTEGEKPMSYYGSKLMISKPNLTVLADKLIEEGYIERVLSPADRRVVMLRLTVKGRNFFQRQRALVTELMLEKLEDFSDPEITRLNELFGEIKSIFMKNEGTEM
ncbi:MarR family winged helix-turn-helix transcriptional regulator [Acidaminobacter hydrogenoformans]|uniref:DNA-binding transcriptional regulator, MarR family n=1 Tax=Acidaminobacter hydrogenoformans DSM 2784 TaxID=1120920 RepID=A0A1G5S0F3_9FIRM|nr:MarR family transcriptional regulator [Acidaminobacter hydrogenoformans]SCZ79736.1 DNA-binding transcriptional regulator, MarR family [Acidaminobacter hydrogenoformans DSM 2784]